MPPPPAPRRHWLRRLLLSGLRVTLLLAILIGGTALVGWRWLDAHILVNLPADLSSFRDWRPPTTCRVLAADGSEIDEFSLERRTWVSIEELAPTTAQAFIALEDRRFYEHHGVDYLGIARAFYVNFQSGTTAQGGSTITQQLVKNLLVGRERSYERKLKEAALAIRLEQELSKAAVLELFVNFVYLGAGNYGVEAAAQDYWGISARELNPGQAALLAGLVPAPARYNPRRSPELAKERRSLVLRGMVEEGYVTAEAAQGWRGEPVDPIRHPPVDRGRDASYITEVRRELRRLLPPDVVFGQGLRVHTALEPAVQAVAEEAVRQSLRDLDARQGRVGAVDHVSPERIDAWLQRAPLLARDLISAEVKRPAPGDCFQALVNPFGDLNTLLAGPFTFALVEADAKIKVRGEGEQAPGPLEKRVAAGDVLRVCLVEGEEVRLDDRPWGEGAAVVIDHRSGQVRAVVGGYEVPLEGFDRATQARRQPGSSFKPYVYGTALLSGKTQVDDVVDGPLSLPAGGGKIWSPQNYDGGYAGRLPMRLALAKSLNTVAVRLVLEVGPRAVAATAKAMGVRSPIRRDPTIALGSSEVTPMDQAIGYTTIARMGTPTDPVWITRLEDADGKELGRAGGPVVIDGHAVATLPGGPLPRALPAGVAYELADMLREVVQSGTARRAKAAGFDRAGKTGTTNDFVDAWFVGFTPRTTVAVWVGSDTTRSLGEKETGGKSALPAWLRIVESLGEPQGERFVVPDGAIRLPWQGRWVGLPRGAVPASLLRTAPLERKVPLGPFPGSGLKAP